MLLLQSSLVLAGEFSWSSQSFGGMLTRGGQVLKSKQLQPSSPFNGRAIPTKLVWKIIPDGRIPADLKIKFCSLDGCLTLPDLAGEISFPSGYSASWPYRFEYVLMTRGVISPPLTILSNQITVNYVDAKND
ncbi:flagellar protein FlhE [Citrobacter sp. wls619]|uniref:flagellar protein FlhE n=1 Tax=Citrobacter sp. wls619 TaxID=2576432 RepID=UPI0010C987F7|nr:flagellar protein FlhE [Citrobacter sp. wls619]TKV07846.1 flagellar protein FlhE [Citrobacter sp. wls619]